MKMELFLETILYTTKLIISRSLNASYSIVKKASDSFLFDWCDFLHDVRTLEFVWISCLCHPNISVNIRQELCEKRWLLNVSAVFCKASSTLFDLTLPWHSFMRIFLKDFKSNCLPLILLPWPQTAFHRRPTDCSLSTIPQCCFHSLALGFECGDGAGFHFTSISSSSNHTYLTACIVLLDTE